MGLLGHLYADKKHDAIERLHRIKAPTLVAAGECDIQVPLRYSRQVCEKIRENPLTRSVPILIISATSDEDAKQRAIAAGATAYYTKPFSPMALLKEIESIRVKQKSTPGV